MAITFDAFTKLADGVDIQGLTASHTVTGSNPAIMVWIFANNSGDVVTGVTYNGVAMTQVAKKARSDYALQICYLYYLPNCATGSNNVVISSTLPITNSTVYAVSYAGVANAGVENSGSAATGSATASASATTIDSGAWLIGGAWTALGDSSLTASTNTTQRAENTYVNVGDSNAVSLTPGSNALTWTLNNTQWVCIIASIAPAATGTQQPNRRMRMGLG